ncbi:hypothetical protein SAMN05444955_10577 [Lihuaxuella thermophila]|uniref:Uncharacterized protein n=1 Tax=Lihuaxuella thermophila TaxID=1173111 RepID=A0A1H8DC83_9BACL|nr:hypothetical protein SAMN05444955_10577 [Lihuaxuella thermophila]
MPSLCIGRGCYGVGETFIHGRFHLAFYFGLSPFEKAKPRSGEGFSLFPIRYRTFGGLLSDPDTLRMAARSHTADTTSL